MNHGKFRRQRFFVILSSNAKRSSAKRSFYRRFVNPPPPSGASIENFLINSPSKIVFDFKPLEAARISWNVLFHDSSSQREEHPSDFLAWNGALKAEAALFSNHETTIFGRASILSRLRLNVEVCCCSTSKFRFLL